MLGYGPTVPLKRKDTALKFVYRLWIVTSSDGEPDYGLAMFLSVISALLATLPSCTSIYFIYL
jgi:hypothetical protein